MALHPKGGLREVELTGVGQLGDVMATKEGEFDWKTMNKSNLM